MSNAGSGVYKNRPQRTMEENFVRISEQGGFVSRFPNIQLGLESRINIFCDIMLFLKDEYINWIEVHGMTGVGKTTLVKEVATFAAEEGLFDEILWLEVCEEPDVCRIQDQIARAFDFSLDPQESEATRAEVILKMLMKRNAKRVLIVLDDVWHEYYLFTIGLLGPNYRSACKLIFTSSQIKESKIVDRFISVMVLPKEEAFILFNQIVGLIEDAESTDLAREIVEICEGLPRTVKVIAQKLRGRPLSEWELALQKLRRSIVEFDRGILYPIKRNYSWTTKQSQFMFLLCGVIGVQISYEDLSKYGLYLALFGRGDLQNKVNYEHGMHFLENNCMLLEGRTPYTKRMSKICCDAAMVIASSDPDWFIVRKDGGAIEWPENDILAQVRYISLQVSIGTLELPAGLSLPDLEFLHVYDENGLLKIADNFFTGMNKTGSKVLALINIQLLPLPSSLLNLTNIDTLCLDYCVLGDISMIGELQTLRVLSLSHTNIQQLPAQIRQLTSLCMLDLSNCLSLNVIPAKLLSNLTKLKYLLMKNSFTNWRVEDNDRSDKASLGELTSLTSLHTLEIDIPNVDMIPEALPWDNWGTYHIVIGKYFQCYGEDEGHKNCKVLKWNHDNDSKRWLRSLLKTCDVLWLKKSKGFNPVFSEVLRLKHLYIPDNAELEYFTRSYISYWRNLVVVRIRYCPSLRFVFEILTDYSSFDTFPLQELEIAACGNMDAVVINNQQKETFDFTSLGQLRTLTLQKLDKLVIFWSYTDTWHHRWERPLLRKVDLPGLKHLKLVKIPKVTHLVKSDTTNTIPLQNLETLEINDCNEISQIFNIVFDIDEDDGVWTSFGHMRPTQIQRHAWIKYMGKNRGFGSSDLLPNLRQLRLQNLPNFKSLIGDGHLQRRIQSFKMLNKLTVRNCNQLRYLLPHYVLENLKLLQYIDISDCSMLEQVFLCEEGPIMTVSEKKVLPFLHSLKLSNLPELASICSGAPRLITFHLNQMTIDYCPKLTFSFAQSPATSMTNSEEIIIEPSLLLNLTLRTLVKKMWDDPLMINFRHMISLQLYGCDNWEYLFSSLVAQSLPSLQELEIISCNIRTVIGESNVTATVDTVEFPQVATLILEKLPGFTKFCHNNCTIKWLSLKKLRVAECHDIEESALGVLDRTLLKSVEVIDCSPWETVDPGINVAYLFKYTDKSHINLTIEGSHQLNKYMTMLRLFSSFTELETLEARKCDKELNKLLSILLRKSQKLEQLTVEKCEQLEQVFDLGGFDPEGNGRFSNLNTMRLSDLPNLNCLWNKDPSGIVDLQSLVTLEIIKCGSLRNLVSISVAENLVKLKELYIDSCEMIEVVTINVGEVMENQGRSFPNLNNLRLLNLPNFIEFNSQNLNSRFPNLQRLTIEHCPKMNVFTTGFLSAQAPDSFGSVENKIEEAYLKLESLKLVGLKTYEIWQGCLSTESFRKLQELEVDTLSEVEYIFPSDSGMMLRLENLTKLVVSNCSSLTNLFQPFGNNSVSVAQNLEIIQVKSCDSLRHLQLCPSKKLKEIEISECRNLEEIFMDTGEQIMDAKIISHLEAIMLEKLPVLSSFYLGIFEFPSLVKVRIADCPLLQTFIPGSSPNVSAASGNSFMNMESLGKLKELHLINVNSCQNIWNKVISSSSRRKLKKTYVDESSAVSNIIPYRWPWRKLKKINVQSSNALGVSSENHENSKSEMKLLGTLDVLVLSDLPCMQLWEQEPKIPVFTNLTSLEIIRCNSIQKLFSIAVAENLHALKLLKLYECENLVQVLQGGGGNSKKVFQNLECIILKHLPNLTSFCEQEVEFEFSRLHMVSVKDIPRMKIFVAGSLKTPRLKTIYILSIINCWQGDLNATIKYLSENQGGGEEEEEEEEELRRQHCR